jgi:hypothetical protein
MTASVIGLAAGGREGRFGNGSKSGLERGAWDAETLDPKFK